MPRTLDQLPSFLRQYCIEHDTSKYSSRDHAAWRYIMRRAVPFFRRHAVNGYEEGLAATGLSVDHIPHIDDIDRALQTYGWGAVPVCGFIPPWAFLEFQARQILPIATDMRSVDHIAYTPAPDIVHEAAGHAPILPDAEYRHYLAHYAKLGTRAIYSRQDLELYEAVRYLSDIKEKPESTPEQIADAERRLEAAARDFTYVSEATKVGRMSWWTAEYGLAGSLNEPKIYGAGLLSSVGESRDAMTPLVKKIPLSLACTEYSYNITEPQPQLFVAEDMEHLHDVLHQLDDSLAYRTGGIAALQRALEAEAMTSTVLDSGITISGRLHDFSHLGEQPVFLKYTGPAQLAYEEQQMDGHGPERHPGGFSSPLGRWRCYPEKAPQLLNDSELRDHCGIVEGQRAHLTFNSGIEVEGICERLARRSGQLVMITWKDCCVRWGNQQLFQPDWGPFDMVVGDRVSSVYGGPADREQFGEREGVNASTTPGRESPYTATERQLFDFYQKVRDLRGKGQVRDRILEVRSLTRQVLNYHPREWLLLLELLELSTKKLHLDPDAHSWLRQLKKHLDMSSPSYTADQKELIHHGLGVLAHA
jgi:phenylalanine-4-hydroxylase